MFLQFNFVKMLPIFTTEQVKDGIDSTDMMIDLSEYMKKKDGATKTELQSLTAVVAGKLDATPQHKHDIADVKDLREELDSKYDTSKRYSYNVILSDAEKIPYMEAPRVGLLDISANRAIDGYRFYVDDKSGDLMICLNDLLIASYSIAAGKWSFETDTTTMDNSIASIGKRVDNHDIILENHYEALTAVCGATLLNITDIADNSTKITTFEQALHDYVAKTDAVLKNHYEAILLLCQKHGMVDGDGDEGNNISPT
jgi:hypothetical protein